MSTNVKNVWKKGNVKIKFKYTIVRAAVGFKFYCSDTLGRKVGKDGRDINEAESQPSVSSISVSSPLSKF